MSNRKIIISPIFPPVPTRPYDWCAYYDTYEPGQLIGYGNTPEQAMFDLKEAIIGKRIT